MLSLAVAAAAGVIALLFEYGVVQPWSTPRAVAWTTDDSPTDIDGVVAAGEVKRSADGIVHLTGNVLDDDVDGRGAVLIISVDHGDRTDEVRDYNTAGANQSINIGRRSDGRSFPGTIRAISVRECLTEWTDAGKKDLAIDRCGLASVEIWNTDRR